MFNKKSSAEAEGRIGAPPTMKTTATADSLRAIPTTPNNASQAVGAAGSDGIVLIGRGTKINGQITDCATLEIQGVVEGSVVADVIVIHEGGVVKGDVRALRAEVHGLFEGQLVVAELLDVRGTGHVEGELSYGKLAVAMGGYIHGTVRSEDIAAGRQEQAPPQVSAGVQPNQPFSVIHGGTGQQG